MALQASGIIEPISNTGILTQRKIADVTQNVDVVSGAPSFSNYGTAMDLVKNWLGSIAGAPTNVHRIRIIVEFNQDI